jgi:competence protein ComEC
MGVFLITTNFYVWSDYSRFEQELGELHIQVLDIGQGDAILIKTPENNYAIIDAGPGSTGHSKLIDKLPFMEDTVDLIIATHADYDHIGSIQDVLNSYKTEIVFIAPTTKDNGTIQSLRKHMRDGKIKNAHLNSNTDFTFDSIKWNILWPTETTTLPDELDENDRSYGIELSYNNFTFVSMGDLSKEQELSAINDLESSTSTILKISHHGSQTSTSMELLEQLNPQVALISAGQNNSYGHPHSNVLSMLNATNTPLLRTDLEGDIEIKTDGMTYLMIRTERNSEWEFIKLSKPL